MKERNFERRCPGKFDPMELEMVEEAKNGEL
jgi:hypothetical protein